MAAATPLLVMGAVLLLGLLFGRDRRLLRRAEMAAAAVAESEQRYYDLFENATAPIVTVDLEDRITEVNEAFVGLVGYRREELVGGSIVDYLASGPAAVLRQQMRRKLEGKAEATRYEQTLIDSSGSHLTVELESRLVRRGGEPVAAQAILRDVTEQLRATAELHQLAARNEWLASHDPLTNLPNRRGFREQTQNALDSGTACAVLLLDLNRFREINDTLGHNCGDQLLTQLVEQLRRRLRGEDQLARLGGDEFAILIATSPSAIGDACASTVSRIEQALQHPFTVNSIPLRVEASIGIARSPADGETAELLLQHADIALYEAKRTASSHRYYTAKPERHSPHHLKLLGELERALSQDELILHYQPMLNLHTGSVERVEALIRWQHPNLGLQAPSAFITAAEQTTLIGRLTLQVIDRSLAQIEHWQQDGLELGVAVNLSTRNLTDPELPQQLQNLLLQHPGGRDRLLLEITESALIADPEHARKMLGQLRALGLKLALDDFGSGYTSLAFLRDYPLQEIKIDRAFIHGVESDLTQQAIPRAIISLGHDLGLQVVAEGVETPQAEQLLKQLGCDIAQGFRYSPALPPPELAAWLRDHQRLVAVA